VKVIITELPYPTLRGLLKQEGASSPADVIYTKDLVYMSELNRDGFFQPMPAAITKKVDASMHDPQNLWTAVTYRARTLIYESSLDVSDINTYEDLAKADYKGTFCIRDPGSYATGPIASLVVNYGYDKAQAIVQGWMDNRTENKLYADDTAVIKAIATGAMTADGSQQACLLGLSNSYYLAQYLKVEPNAPVKIKFLKQGKNGTHVNGTAAGIAKSSKQPELAGQFVDLLLSKDIQIYLTNEHQDFPAALGVKPVNVAAQWLPFDFAKTNWATIGDDDAEAQLIMVDTLYK
jgi:iron(III) transport system substrate-binding protein